MNEFRANTIKLITELSDAINLHDQVDTDRLTMLPLMSINELRTVRDKLLDMAAERGLDL